MFFQIFIAYNMSKRLSLACTIPNAIIYLAHGGLYEQFRHKNVSRFVRNLPSHVRFDIFISWFKEETMNSSVFGVQGILFQVIEVVEAFPYALGEWILVA